MRLGPFVTSPIVPFALCCRRAAAGDVGLKQRGATARQSDCSKSKVMGGDHHKQEAVHFLLQARQFHLAAEESENNGANAQSESGA